MHEIRGSTIKGFAVAAALLALVGTRMAHANEEAAGRHSAFGPGEQLTFRVQYLGMQAGTARITVGAETFQWGRQVLPLVVEARTEKLLNWYPIRDRFISYWDPSAERCIGSDFFMDENRVRRRQRIKLDHETGKATVTRQQEGKEERVQEYDVPTGTYDMAAATFALRNLPLDIGQRHELPVFTGRRAFIMQATVERREVLKTAQGNRDTFRVRVKTGFDGKFESKRDIVTWLSADEAKVPLRVEADFVLGTIRAELVEYKSGRRYLLSSVKGPDTQGG